MALTRTCTLSNRAWLTSASMRPWGAVPPVRPTSAKDALAGRLGHQVDRAAGRAAPEQHRRGAEEHLDAFQVEGVAREPAEVAAAVAEHVGLAGEAAQDEGVALTPAFAGADRDARDVAEGFAHGGGPLLLEHLLGHHRHRLGRVPQGGGQPLHPALLGLVRLGLTLDLHGGEHDGGRLLGGAGRRLAGGGVARPLLGRGGRPAAEAGPAGRAASDPAPPGPPRCPRRGRTRGSRPGPEDRRSRARSRRGRCGLGCRHGSSSAFGSLPWVGLLGET